MGTLAHVVDPGVGPAEADVLGDGEALVGGDGALDRGRGRLDGRRGAATFAGLLLRRWGEGGRAVGTGARAERRRTPKPRGARVRARAGAAPRRGPRRGPRCRAPCRRRGSRAGCAGRTATWRCTEASTRPAGARRRRRRRSQGAQRLRGGREGAGAPTHVNFREVDRVGEPAVVLEVVDGFEDRLLLRWRGPGAAALDLWPIEGEGGAAVTTVVRDECHASSAREIVGSRARDPAGGSTADFDF